jgi:hypothetical protein
MRFRRSVNGYKRGIKKMARVLIYDRLPKWVFLTIAIVVTFLLVGGLNYFWDEKPPVSYPIGKFNDVKMDEKIDNDADRGISSSDR